MFNQSETSSRIAPGYLSESAAPRISVEVIFGHPAKDCAGTGICRITEHAQRPFTACPLVPGSARASNKGLCLVFHENDLPQSVIDAQFPDGFLRIASDFALPAFICNFLQSSGPAKIPAGAYPVLRRNKSYSINLSVKHSDSSEPSSIANAPSMRAASSI